ncbi:MAG: hypothetical protein ACRD29_06390 [Acidimicrobiales bacterium]
MTKPRGVKWLEDQTGETLDKSSPSTEAGRHLSVCLPGPLVSQLEALASQRGEALSQVTRRLVADGLARASNPDREALDTAIAALEQLRNRLGPPAA